MDEHGNSPVRCDHQEWHVKNRASCGCTKAGHLPSHSETPVMFDERATDTGLVRQGMPLRTTTHASAIPWALQMRAVSLEEPGRLLRMVTGAILGCGGWVLSRATSDTGAVNLLFEFERRNCLDIYSVLVAAGVELSQNGHIRFTELFQCTRLRPVSCGDEIASIDLEIQTFPLEAQKGERGSADHSP